MNISRENIEFWMLDFLEGSLSRKEEEGVREFLNSNPDLLEASGDLKNAYLEPEAVPFQDKERLKKKFPGTDSEPDASNFDMFAIACMEQDLHPERKEAFEHFLVSNPLFQKAYELWLKTRLEREDIRYPYKKKLKKAVPRRLRTIWMMIPAAAASALILFLILSRPAIEESVAVNNVPADTSGQQSGQIQSEPGREILLTDRTDESGQRVTRSAEGRTRSTAVVAENRTPGFRRDGPDDIHKSEVINGGAGFSSKDLRIKIPYNKTLVMAFTPEADKIKPLSLPNFNPVEEKRSSILMAGKNLEEALEDFALKDRSFWDIAASGIDGINRLTGSDMELMASRDQEGSVSYFQFSSRRLKIAVPVKGDRPPDRP